MHSIFCILVVLKSRWETEKYRDIFFCKVSYTCRDESWLLTNMNFTICFNFNKFYIFFEQFIYENRMNHRINNDYFPKQQQQIGSCNAERVCFLLGRIKFQKSLKWNSRLKVLKCSYPGYEIFLYVDILLVGKRRPACKADNLTTICEPIV
jgi:hypothetical protein